MFLNKFSKNSHRGSDDSDNLLKIKCLVDVMEHMSISVGDDKIITVFKNILSALMLETEDEAMKNLCLRVLSEFNEELNIKNN